MSIKSTALIEIVGVHDERWTVSGKGMGEQGVELDQDPENLFDEAPFTTIWEQGATQEGATFLASNPDPIDLVLVFDIFGDDDLGLDWEDVEAKFFDSFDVKKPARIEVTTKAGMRWINVVKMDKTQQLSKKDPRLTGHSKLQVTLRAPWPYWTGDTVIHTFVAPKDASLGSFKIDNPTDTNLWPQWVATAPGRWNLPDYSWVDDEHYERSITTPPLKAGQDLTVDTYPRRETYTAADGSNVAGHFGGMDFLYPIPPRTPETTVFFAYEGLTPGVSSLQLRLVHMWRRPAGVAR